MDAPSRILNFPNQLISDSRRLRMLDDDGYILQARLHAIKLMRGIQDGWIPPEPDIIQNLKNLNVFLAEWDTPLDLTFLD